MPKNRRRLRPPPPLRVPLLRLRRLCPAPLRRLARLALLRLPHLRPVRLPPRRARRRLRRLAPKRLPAVATRKSNERPETEVRPILRQDLCELRIPKDAGSLESSSVVLVQKFSWRTRSCSEENF